MHIRPLHDRILAKRLAHEDKTSGGLFIPDTAKEKPLEAEVIAVGNGKVLENGSLRALEVKAGDKVLIGKYSGAEMVKEVASKTSDVAGDGTTTATVLAQAIYHEGAKLVTAGANPMDIKRGIDAAVEVVVGELKTQSKPTKGKTEIAQVGTISA